MMSPQQHSVFVCTACGWSGASPSYTDRSDIFPANHQRAGEAAHSHDTVCPDCGKHVTSQTVNPRALPVAKMIQVDATSTLARALEIAVEQLNYVKDRGGFVPLEGFIELQSLHLQCLARIHKGAA